MLAPDGLKVSDDVPPLRVALLPRNVTLGELMVKALPPAIRTVWEPAKVTEPPAFWEFRATEPDAPALNVGLPVKESVFVAPLLACSVTDAAPPPVALKVPEPATGRLPVLVIESVPALPVDLIVLLFVSVPPLRAIVVLAPDTRLLAVRLPVGVNVSVPLVEVILPDVPMFAEPPVVVTEKLLPTVDVDKVTEPALVIKAVPAPVVFAESVET